MGISFKIDAEEGIIYAIAEGNIRPDDVQAYRKNLRTDPKYQPGLGEIIEYRSAQFLLSDEDVNTLASTVPVDRPRKVALVAVGPQKERALQYKEWRNDMPVEVFEDLGSAKKWITSD